MRERQKVVFDIQPQLEKRLKQNHYSVMQFEKTFRGRYKNIVQTAKHIGYISKANHEKILAIINKDGAEGMNGSQLSETQSNSPTNRKKKKHKRIKAL